MKNAFFALVIAAALCGCGHNVVNYGDGIMLETTCNPETYTFGFSFRYGKILSAVLRENSELEVDASGNGSAAAGNDASGAAANKASIRLKTGAQTSR